MRIRRYPALVCAVALIAAPLVVNATSAAASSHGFAPVMALTNANNGGGQTTGGAEPSIEVDSHGQVYVSAPVGVPTGGCPFWEIDPKKRTSLYRGTIDTDRFSVGGGDCDISLSDGAPGATHDVASITSLSLANLTSNITTDGGKTFFPVANPASQQIFGVDRQWQASDRGLGRHYLTVHDLATVNIQVAVAQDGGYQYVSNTPAIDPLVAQQALATGVGLRGYTGGNSFGTTVVDPVTHKLYIPFVAPKGATFDGNAVYLAEGDPCSALFPCTKGAPVGPITWKNHLVYSTALTNDLGSGFPAIAMDSAGVIHLAWTGDPGKAANLGGSGQDLNRVFTIRSQPRGVSNHVSAGQWTQPRAVDTGSGQANVFPWLVAGNAGNVGIGYYSSKVGVCTGEAGPTTDVNDRCNNEWKLSYSSSSDANSSNPTWKQTEVSVVIHKGAICTGGLSCPAGTRVLLDFFDIALDAQGAPHFAYNSDVRARGTADLHYTYQCTGTTLRGIDLGNVCGGTVETPVVITCPGDGSGFLDKPGDATEVVVTGETPLPNDPAVDLLDGQVVWDAPTSTARFRARVKDAQANPFVGDTYIRWQITLGNTAYQLIATRSVTGAQSFSIYGGTGATVTTQTLQGSFNPATGIVEIKLPSAKYMAAKSGNAALAIDTAVTVTAVIGQRSTGAATLSTDTATTLCSKTLGAATEVTPAPVVTAPPLSCPAGPQIIDPENDSELAGVPTLGWTQDSQLDITKVRLAVEGTSLVARVTVADMVADPQQGAVVRVGFTHDEQAYELRATRGADGVQTFSWGIAGSTTTTQGTSLPGTVTGSFDSLYDTITITLPAATYAAGQPGKAPLTSGNVAWGINAVAQRLLGVATVTSDSAKRDADCTLRVSA